MSVVEYELVWSHNHKMLPKCAVPFFFLDVWFHSPLNTFVLLVNYDKDEVRENETKSKDTPTASGPWGVLERIFAKGLQLEKKNKYTKAP